MRVEAQCGEVKVLGQQLALGAPSTHSANTSFSVYKHFIIFISNRCGTFTFFISMVALGWIFFHSLFIRFEQMNILRLFTC